ncbi:LysR family transcriptional regulator, hydrogen peroxide-inducible genes activator [Bowdeniella nasicola]|uniref:Probable hydrogen peroxide-inducible genes activator n=1 Tax=Bowdeniella nasicola TaxID=208480 RepID=A0A1H4BL44_9ACTO|nr:LysR substrate-binding domain-containing protein [Bowdeniella nasicola]SEA48869.1 LysR family transcriptional regulator, hydrogen peroxide-inducible genes activator [Bowdeniella nasicola]
MKLRDLEYLVALAEEGNFSRAAVRAGVSQPTLSTQIKKLETELGVPLVERTPAGLLFTEAGRQVLARARHVMSDLAEIRMLAQQAADPASATLTLGMFPTLGPYLLPRLMPHLAERLPELKVRLVEDKSEALLAQLLAGEIDAVTLAEPPAADGLAAEDLFREEFLLAAPRGHALVEGELEPLRLSALRDVDVLLLDDGHCLRDHALSLCQSVGARQANFRATSLESLRYMVAGGAGVTLMPRLAVTPPVAAVDTLELREFAAPAPYRDISLIWRETSALAPLMGELAAALREAGSTDLGS